MVTPSVSGIWPTRTPTRPFARYAGMYSGFHRRTGGGLIGVLVIELYGCNSCACAITGTSGASTSVVEIGFWISSEEHGPIEMVRAAQRAEEAGFPYVQLSDHFHPWIDRQGQSSFVWAVIGAIASSTEELRLGTGVTCPMIRMHPAIVAQAAATAACLMPGRFFLGVGTGENLNEHVTGAKWPAADERLSMLEESIELMRELWQGDYVTHRGKHYTVDRARLYTVPDEPPPIAIAAAAENAAELAGRVGDTLVSTAPDEDVVKTFEQAGGKGKPKYGQFHVCVADSREQAVETAFRCWRNGASQS